MTPYDEIDEVLADIEEEITDGLTPLMGKYQDRLYTILENTIEAARKGEYAD